MFSVLISVYKSEKPSILQRALRSIWHDQILKPTEIVCVIDGPIGNELFLVIKKFQDEIGHDFKILQLEENVGLGNALSKGLIECSFDLVARMDTDDISLNTRFQKQIEYFNKDKSLKVLGSFVEEFSDSDEKTDGKRIVPINPKEIIKYAKFKNPMNHPTIMYRKSAVLDSGGPIEFKGFDDYFLWVRMILNNHKFKNIPEVLVKVQAGNALIERRAGFNYAKQEMKFQIELKSLGFLTYFEFCRNILLRVSVRLLPKSIVRSIYSNLLRK